MRCIHTIYIRKTARGVISEGGGPGEAILIIASVCPRIRLQRGAGCHTNLKEEIGSIPMGSGRLGTEIADKDFDSGDV